MPPPPPPDPRVNLAISVQGTSNFDPGTSLYTYTYLVTNNVASGNALKTFGLAPIEFAIGIGSEAHWTGFDRWERRIDTVVWTVTDNIGVLPTDSLDIGDMPASPYCTPPGQSVTFTIISRQPPATVSWYAQGEDSLRHVDEEPFEGILDPDDGFFGLVSVKGTTIGPDVHSPVGVEEGPDPAGFIIQFRPAAPNPFGRQTYLTYVLNRRARVRLDVFDVQGRLIRTLENNWHLTGPQSTSWDGRDQAGGYVASGMYFVRFLVDGAIVARQRVVFLK